MKRIPTWLALAFWAWGCPTSIAPFPDVTVPDVSGTDQGTGDPGAEVSPVDPGSGHQDVVADLGGDPGSPPDGGPIDAQADLGGDDVVPPADVPGDTGTDSGMPGDPCGTVANPQCLPDGCMTPGGMPGVCRQDPAGTCRCVEETVVPECLGDGDCVNRYWLVNCQGHWDCIQGLCREACGVPCGDQVCDSLAGESPLSCSNDCPLVVPCMGNEDCDPSAWCARDAGQCTDPGTCQPRPTICSRIYQPVCGCDGQDYQNACQASAAGVAVRTGGTCPAQQCAEVADCLGRPWLVDCVGHWACTRLGACSEVCDFDGCGDGRCDPRLGEDSGSCPKDCRPDICALQAGPFCLPWDCTRSGGLPGRCGTGQDGACGCGPKYGSCAADRDCLGQVWPVRCATQGGHWDCIEGACEPICGNPCGDGFCDREQGEDPSSCSQDCPPRDVHCDDGTEPLCEMIPPRCNEWEILAYQNSCYVCVNPATCRPWGEPGCAGDADCRADQWCSPCGTSSCPLCDNCLPACVAHGCPTDPVADCAMVRPDCGQGAVAVIQNGCWVCVDRSTCLPVVF
ncbi:MAG TPA: hypothetical protein PLQ97_12340 [Myxococcota bacterium]|nr:hypothetical protein [Myxococcota bacterium]HQK51854.1 hypothetical protein [Myxococcota bacterium]